MKSILGLLLLLFGLAMAPPAMAQAPAGGTTFTTPAIPSVTLPGITLPAVPSQQVSPGHAMALGVGLFVGAVAGSVLIQGGALAAAIGGVAGLAVGHWAWNEAD